MESRLIYILSRNKDVSWLNSTRENGSWLYMGNDTESRRQFASQIIQDHFSLDTLYVVKTRNDSFETTKDDFIGEIENMIGVQEFLVWDTNFIRVVEFNIDVLRCGEAQITSNH